MINIRDVTILDILPYTFKTAEYEALSRAIAKMTAKFYDTMSAVLFWNDIDNASEAVLDAMAAELDAPFYSTDMTVERKRAVIAAAFLHNAQAGTVSALSALLTAAFGGGDISEWYTYGGEPYYFKVDLYSDEDIHTTLDDYDYFLKLLDKVKNKRAKLDSIIAYENIESGTYALGRIIADEQTEDVGAKYLTSGTDRVYKTLACGGAVTADTQLTYVI